MEKYISKHINITLNLTNAELMELVKGDGGREICTEINLSELLHYGLKEDFISGKIKTLKVNVGAVE